MLADISFVITKGRKVIVSYDPIVESTATPLNVEIRFDVFSVEILSNPPSLYGKNMLVVTWSNSYEILKCYLEIDDYGLFMAYSKYLELLAETASGIFCEDCCYDLHGMYNIFVNLTTKIYSPCSRGKLYQRDDEI